MPQTHSDESPNDSVSPNIIDHCPDWAEKLIQMIYVMEVEAGHIANPTAGQWATKTQDDLLKLAEGLEHSAGSHTEDDVEALFVRICRGLRAETFEHEAIADMINVRIPTGSRLKYCSATEVLEASRD